MDIKMIDISQQHSIISYQRTVCHSMSRSGGESGKKPKYVEIMDYIRSEILSGRLAPDQKLPSESDLMRRFGVSRIVAVNALTRLTEAGLIYRLHGKGSFVAGSENDTMGPMGTEQSSFPRHIALIVQGFGDDFSMGLTAGVQRAALLSNIFCSQYSSFVDELPPSEVEGPLIRFVMHSGAQGLLLFPVAQEIYNKELLRLADMDFPVVLLDRELIGLGFPCVQTDHRLTGRMAAEACIQAGHQRIAYCTTSVEIQPVIQRLEGFQGAMQERDLPCGGELLLTDRDLFHARDLFKKLLLEGVTAVVSSLSSMTDILYDLLEHDLDLQGMPSPSILTIDKSDTTDRDRRAPSYIAQDTAAIGERAVALLQGRVRRTHRQYEVIKIPPKYIDNGTITPR